MTVRPKPNLPAAYRRGELAEFFAFAPQQVEAALSAPRDVDRAALCAALRAYHADLSSLDAGVEAQLARLAHPDSRAVVTGQQAGLLGGPAYSVHKGADAVLLARRFGREDRPLVPIYWVASQDHDAAEVAGTTLLDMGETLHQLRLDLPAGVPIGRVPWRPEWTGEVLGLLSRFEAPEAHKARVRALLERALAGGSYADVFARLMHALLGGEGLVMLDPMHPALAPLFAPAIARELADPLASSARVEDSAAQLEARGFAPQLRRAPGATNLFLEGEDGVRRLLRFENGVFTAGRRHSEADLLAVLKGDPARLTPAAGLRPTLQDGVLPTALLVAGPGEISYGAELRGVYALHGVTPPLWWPRLSVTWLEPPVARILGRFGLTAGEFQRDPQGTLGEALLRLRGAGGQVAGRIGQLEATFDALARDIRALDPTLVGAVERTEQKVSGRLTRLRAQATRALLRAEDERSGQVGRLRLHLLPNGVPQEREMNFLSFLLKHGDAPLGELLSLEPGWTGELTL